MMINKQNYSSNVQQNFVQTKFKKTHKRRPLQDITKKTKDRDNMPKVINMPMLQSFINNTMVMNQPKPTYQSPLKPIKRKQEKSGFQSALFLTPMKGMKGNHYLDYIFNSSSKKNYI